MAFTAGGRFNFITAKGATSVQEEHFHSVYFAAGTASASLPRQGVRRRCPQRAILAGGHLVSSLWGLRTRAVCSRAEQDAFWCRSWCITCPNLADPESPPYVTDIRVRSQNTNVYESYLLNVRVFNQ